MREIAKAVGFREVAFQFEPIAAAFDYESQITREELVLVADIGGGTSDFSLVRLSPERAAKADRRGDILANGGVHIGGTDFDKYLSLSSVMPLLGMGSPLRSGRQMPSTQYFNPATRQPGTPSISPTPAKPGQKSRTCGARRWKKTSSTG